MTAFVVLHYRAVQATIQCVESILALDGDKRVLIVDAASPYGTGAALARRYEAEPLVHVILSPENMGYARGNNLGIRAAWEELEPDFVVAVNNDVEIRQKDFILQLERIYAQRPFDLLGPDILSVFSGIHQNPKSLHGCTLDSVRKKLAYVRRSQNPILLLLSSGEKNSPAIWRQVQRRRRAKQHIDSSQPAEGPVLHGACVVFARPYLARHPEPFYPKTFMYYEMEILDWLCRREGSRVLYEPSLHILHYQHMATKMEFSSIVKHSKFVMDCLEQSLLAAEELILSAQAGEEPAAHTEERTFAGSGL